MVPPQAALVHRKSLLGVRGACEQVWGQEGSRALILALPEEVRQRTAGLHPLPDWLPVDDLIAWHVAAWDGPAQRDKTIMAEHARRTIDHGFGRVKRFLLSMATPHTLAPRVAALWSDEYSTGRLVTSGAEPNRITLSLRDHAYVEHPLMSWIIAEAFRYIVSLTGVKGVTEQHTARDGTLVILLRWR